ncbi:flagellar basal body P-ring formation chaperone FlgA [Amaricoccus solimangrovi]|uniref:Flagella basal body P-ring formation protein FlgA n=1 Tax=Amaricoccus solimangrovi TaxID=2589815 RepID=A0A501WSU4_9RHOB|nr:flagellar basal body P-ring formation chaperone FlgA [Amaricoccus solimangrovi]TPE52499.1 flagellar basal body P-ring formation protein FlgA [Amaricoccus solimangrovi]
MQRLVLLCLAAFLAAPPARAGTVVPARPIRGQSILTAGDLTLSDADTPGALSSIEEAVGKEAKVTLYTGRPILVNQIGEPALVERNQLVRMTYADGRLSITAEGRALDRAGVGEEVRVMNLTSRQVVTGQVTPRGGVMVAR